MGKGSKRFRQGKGLLKALAPAIKSFMTPNNSSLVRIIHMAPPNYKKTRKGGPSIDPEGDKDHVCVSTNSF